MHIENRNLKMVEFLSPRHKFEMESVNVFEPGELAATKVRLANFLLEIAHQIQFRLPENMKVLKKVDSFNARNVLGNNDPRNVSEVAVHYQTLGGIGIDVTAIESEWRRLRHTSLEVTCNTPLLQFWAKVARCKSGENLLFPQLTRLISALMCLPTSNETVERLFSVMSVVKTKLRNRLAIPMVEAILATRHGMKRRGETCANFKVLPAMMRRFNVRMYDHKRNTAAGHSGHIQHPEEEDDEEDNFVEILNDVQELFGEPVFLIP